MRIFLRLVYWDWVREMKRKETLLSMMLFSLVTLFIFSRAIEPALLEVDPERAGATGAQAAQRLRAGILWVTLLLAGAIGIDRAFRVEEGARLLEGLLLSRAGRATIYYAKVVSTLLYLSILEVAVLLAFAILYDVEIGLAQALGLLGVFGASTFGLVAVGVTLSAMTRALRGGDVLLRILLFALLIPIFWASIECTEAVLAGRPLEWGSMGLIACFDLVYLGAGHALMEPILRDFEGD